MTMVVQCSTRRLRVGIVMSLLTYVGIARNKFGTKFGSDSRNSCHPTVATKLVTVLLFVCSLEAQESFLNMPKPRNLSSSSPQPPQAIVG